MKFSIFPLAILIMSSTSANAQSAWEGAYVGLALSANTGEQEYCDCTGDIDYDLTGDTTGLFAGYNYNMGAYLLGGEIAISGGSVYEEDASSDDVYKEYDFESFIDLKGRVGYDFGAFMAYGVLGFSTAEWSEDGDRSDSTGLLLGAGADYAITPQFIVGAEFASRSLENDEEDFEATVNSFSLRGSYKF